MPREVKHGRHGSSLEDAVPSASVAKGASSNDGDSVASVTSVDDPGATGAAGATLPTDRRPVGARWFAALDPAGAPPPHAVELRARGSHPGRPGRPGVLTGMMMVLALAVGALKSATGALRRRWRSLRAKLSASAARSQLGEGRAGRNGHTGSGGHTSADDLRAPGDRQSFGRGLELDAERLSFHATLPSRSLLRLDAPFGVTLLASPRRDRLIALLSSATGTFYLGAAFDAAARRAFAPLLDRCFTVVGDDAGMEAIGPDGEPLVFAPDELASLLDALVEQSPSCLDRFVLTDARGAPITLDGRNLCVGDRAVDLNAPLEWKPIVFQEPFGQAIAVYQGTWIRQSSTELTLVSLLPALGPTPSDGLDPQTLDRAVLRDLRLMQASPEAPPPSEQRVAIDRLFMLPVRSALDRAPRASHQPNRMSV